MKLPVSFPTRPFDAFSLLSNQRRLCLWLLISLSCARAWAVDYWQPIADPNLRAIVATADRVVAVGDPGYVVTSTNGVDWQQCTVPTAGILTSVAYGNGKYLAVGGKGDAIYSEDGVNWHRTHLGVTNILASVQFLGGQFVVSASEKYSPPQRAAYYHHRILLSSNLVDWRAVTISTNNQNIYFNTGVEVDGQYLFGGDSWNYALTSDFIDWQIMPFSSITVAKARKLLHTPLGTLLFGGPPPAPANDSFDIRSVSVGSSSNYYASFALSTNVSSWLWQRDNFNFYPALVSAVYGHGRLVAVGTGGTRSTRNFGITAISTNGLDWTFSPRPLGQDLYDVCLFKNHFIAVGHRGLILISTDGTKWTEVQPMRPQLPSSLNDVAFADGLFVGVGNSGIITSANGYFWDVRVTNLSSQLWSAAKGTNGWVAVGNDGLVLYSEDGTDWESQSFPGTYDLSGVAYGPNGFVAVSGNTNGSAIFHSSEGHVWTAQSSPAIYLFKITYGGGYYVAVGSNNLVESTDGITWTTRTVTNSIGMTQIIYGDGVYFAGSDDTLLFSSNRTNWLRAKVERLRLTSHALAYGPAGYVAGGRLVWLHSQNGINWQAIYPINYDYTLLQTGAAYGVGTYVMVGTQSFFSRKLLPRTRITSTENPVSLRLNINTDPGLPFVVQATESLDDPHWQDVPGIAGTNAYESFEIPMQGTAQRFYRAVPRR